MKKHILASIIAGFATLLHLNAQITAPDSVVVELTGPSTSAYTLPAKIVVKTFGPASSTFSGSNNKPETGSTAKGYYSQEVESGATFFALPGTMPGFPARSGNSPQPNRNGGSSFLAIKADGEGNRKYWMNISVGAYRISGDMIEFNWEYQFRYFYDTKTGEEKGSIGAVPNSGAYTPTVVDFIVSIGSKKCKPFEGIVKNAVANITQSKITNDPLANAIITLYEGTKKIDSKTTDGAGAYKFSTDTLSKDKLYNLTVTFNADTVPLSLLIDNVKVCNAAPEIIVPNRLYRQVQASINSLNDLTIDASVFAGAGIKIPISGYNLNSIKGELSSWKSIESEREKILETMNRTYLSMYLLNDYYGKSNEVSGKLLKLTYDVADGIYKMITSAKNIEKLVGDEAAKIDKKLLEGASGVELYQLKKDLLILNTLKGMTGKLIKMVYDSFKEGIVKSMLAKFDNTPAGQVGKANFLLLVKAIDAKMFGGKPEDILKDIMKDIVFDIGTKVLVEQYYVAGTQEFVDVISPKIATRAYSGTFAGVAPLVTAQIAESDSKNESAILAGEAFESAGGSFGTVGDFVENAAKIATLTVVGAPLAAPLFTISKFVKGFSLISNSAALYQYGSRYYNITDELENGLAKSFSPSASSLLRMGESDYLARMEETSVGVDISQYNDSLLLYRNKLGMYNRQREAVLIQHIDSLEGIVTPKIETKINQFYAALSANPSNTALAGVYNKVVNNFGDFEMQSIVVKYQQLAHLLDTTDAVITTSLKKEIDTLLVINQSLLKTFVSIDSVLALVTTPYHFVQVSSVIAPKTIVHDTDFELTVKYKNDGNTTTKAFSILLTPSAGLTLLSDSIRVPALAAQQEAIIKVKISAGDIDRSPNLYVAFDSVNSFPKTIFLSQLAKIVTRTDVVNSHEEEGRSAIREISVFPNPSEGNIYVRSNSNLGQVKMELYDMNGTRHISQNNVVLASGQQIMLGAESLTSGIYMLRIQDQSGNIIRTERIILTKK